MTENVAPALAFALLHSLWQGALMAIAAWLTLRAMSRQSAAARHAVGMVFLLAMVVAPGVQLIIYANADAPLHGGPLSAQFGALFGGVAAPVMVAAWVAGVALMLARHWAGLRVLADIETAASCAVPDEWRDRADRMRRALDVANAIAVRVSDAVLTPCVTHVVRPVIWLPASLLAHIPPQQFEALIAHELAHIKRNDWLWSNLQSAVEALLFYHPAVWWLGKRIRLEREQACDDLAVSGCGDALALAEVLAGLERTRHASPRLGLAANGGALLQRITRLLGEAPSRGRRGVLAFLGAMAVTGAMLMGQVGVGGGQPHDLHVEASTAGDLGPGDYREINAIDGATRRFYRASVDAQGRLTEIYRENGRDRPIDADVRAWLSTLAP